MAIAEWELRDATAAGEIRPTAESRMWSRVPGATLDGTLQRALLAYLSELQPVNALRGMRYPSQPGEAGPSAAFPCPAQHMPAPIRYGSQ